MTDQAGERATRPSEGPDAEDSGVDAPEGQPDSGSRPAGPGQPGSSLDDETPGSQGEIEAGSEGDFNGPSALTS